MPADLPATQLLIALPVIATIVGIVVVARSNRLASWVAIGLGSLTLVAAAVQLVQVLRGFASPSSAHPGTVGSLAIGEVHVPLDLLADKVSALTAVVVAIVALVVQVFTRWYLHRDPHYRAFAATVSVFTAAMLLVVVSGDLVLLLIGWEVMGWCSYLLIGHDTQRESARRAAVKAFLVTRVADLAFVIGLIILIVGARSSSIPEVLTYWAGAAASGDTVMLTAAMIALLSGIAGKSAQFPFHDWLPDAMEGPTPASALIHAATMVAAGTVVLARLFPIFALSGTARLVLALLTAVSMVGAALLAFAQPDLQRLLAWSTISQVAVMMSVLAVVPTGGSPDVAIANFSSHAVFKALLFLALGWLSVLVGGTSAVAMAGGARHFPALARPLGIGLLALAGVPPLVGFVSKELILGTAESSYTAGVGLAGPLVLAAVGATVPLTAAYCMRAWLVLSHRTKQEAAEHREVLDESRTVREVRILDMFAPEPAETAVEDRALHVISPSALTGIRVLMVLSVFGGLVIFTPVLEVDLHLRYVLVGVSLLLMIGAALAVRSMSVGSPSSDAAARLPATAVRASAQGVGFDAAYVLLIARPVIALAHLVVALDRDVIDGSVRGSVGATRLAWRLSERAHTRRPSSNLVWVLFGVLAVAIAGVQLW